MHYVLVGEYEMSHENKLITAIVHLLTKGSVRVNISQKKTKKMDDLTLNLGGSVWGMEFSYDTKRPDTDHSNEQNHSRAVNID